MTQHTAADRVFFCNSGAEANEGAIKAARLWGKKHLDGAYGIITANKSFHGRTLATLTATGQSKIQEGFEPLVQGFKHVDYDDLAQAEAAWDDNTCAIMVEPLQGEGGRDRAFGRIPAGTEGPGPEKGRPVDPGRGADRSGTHRQTYGL